MGKIDFDHLKHDALALLESLVNDFPGLLDDTEVNGADLVDAVARGLAQSDDLREFLQGVQE